MRVLPNVPRGTDRYDAARLAGRLWTPAADKGFLYAWFDAADVTSITFFSTSSSFIVGWKDKSGNGRNATTPLNSPQWFPFVVRNVSVNEQMTLTLPASTYDVAFVGRIIAGDNSIVSNGDGGTWPLYRRVSDSAVGSYHTGGSTFTQAGSLTWASNTLGQVWATIPSPTGVRMARDGGALADETGENLTNSTAARISCEGGAPVGDSHEYIFMPPGRAEAHRQRVEGYLAHKWDRLIPDGNLRTVLSPDHPFKNRPPLIGD